MPFPEAVERVEQKNKSHPTRAEQVAAYLDGEQNRDRHGQQSQNEDARATGGVQRHAGSALSAENAQRRDEVGGLENCRPDGRKRPDITSAAQDQVIDRKSTRLNSSHHS